MSCFHTLCIQQVSNLFHYSLQPRIIYIDIVDVLMKCTPCSWMKASEDYIIFSMIYPYRPNICILDKTPTLWHQHSLLSSTGSEMHLDLVVACSTMTHSQCLYWHFLIIQQCFKVLWNVISFEVYWAFGFFICLMDLYERDTVVFPTFPSFWLELCSNATGK